MPSVPSFNSTQVEQISRLLADFGTGSEISDVLRQCDLTDGSGASTKWRRLNWVLLDVQRRDGCANKVLAFIQAFLAPVRFLGKQALFEEHRESLNALLAFSGLSYGSDGKFRRIPAAQTLEEAERRVRTINQKFRGRAIHREVIKYCSSELMQDNYFHAVLEAAKGLAQRIRDMSGIDEDGARLVNRVFRSDQPILAVNKLETRTEKSEQQGFAALLEGCFMAIRNPRAHDPKILWKGEDDTADYLSLISLLHRKLDDCIPTGHGP